MRPDLVIGIDASTTAVKAIVFDRGGRMLGEARAGYPLQTPRPGYVEQDADDWWRALTAALGDLGTRIDLGRVAALAIGVQRETFVLLDEADRPLRPAILWLDERARPQVQRLAARLGRTFIRDTSGKPPDPTPALYSLAWLAEHEPETMKRAATLCDVHGFLVRRLTGQRATSLAAADPLGIVDLQAGRWDARLVEAAGLSGRHLQALVEPGTILGSLTAAAAAHLGLPQDMLVVAGAGDGQLAGLGAGAFDPEVAYLSLGSGVVSGMWSDTYRSADAYRTLRSPTAQGYMLETVLRSGMQLIDWMARSTMGAADGATLARLEDDAERIAPGADGLLVLPYWAGMMNPTWSPSARGAIVGLSLAHMPAHLFRATIEGIAFEQALATAALELDLGRRARRFIVAGGGVRSALLLKCLAACLQRDLAVSPVTEAVALGAAILAARACGWHTTPEAAVAAMVVAPSRVIVPDRDLSATYAAHLAVYRRLLPALAVTFDALGDSLAPAAPPTSASPRAPS